MNGAVVVALLLMPSHWSALVGTLIGRSLRSVPFRKKASLKHECMVDLCAQQQWLTLFDEKPPFRQLRYAILRQEFHHLALFAICVAATTGATSACVPGMHRTGTLITRGTLPTVSPSLFWFLNLPNKSAQWSFEQPTEDGTMYAR